MAVTRRSQASFFVVTVLLSFQCLSVGPLLVSAQGSWQLLLQSAGISSMHTAITHYDTAIMLDRTDVGASQRQLPNGVCRDDPQDLTLKHDCTAHSVMFDPASNTVRPLFVQTDTWCSSGQFFPDGTLVQTGGDYDGNKKIRRLAPCPANGNCDWVESKTEVLTEGRWYASNQLLPDGRQIIVGGRAVFTYEFFPKRTTGEGSFPLQLLKDTNDAANDNYYPYVHLLPDGNLFIFANRDSILLNYNTGAVIRKYPTIPGEPRNYPSAGSSVLLPLLASNGFARAEVLVCGGAALGAFRNPKAQLPASQTCGRMVVTAANAAWAMETMPFRRTMGDMIILPTGDVLIINGAENGSQGWGFATNAVLNPVLYDTNATPQNRFQTFAATTIPRVYHSTANLLSDGRILLAGSNSHQFYTFTGAFPTELRVEAFSPPYLSAVYNNRRPKINGFPNSIKYGQVFTVTFSTTARTDPFEINMLSAPFVTHSYAQGQRLLKLKVSTPVAINGGYSVQVTAPPNGVIAPPAYYMIFPLQRGTPGQAVWVQIS